MLWIQCADYRCNSEDSDKPVHPLSRITSFFAILCTCRHSAPLSFVCEKVHLMRPQAQTDHIDCSNRKPLDYEDSRPRSYRQFWIVSNLQSEFGHTGRMVWIELGCTCTKRNDTYGTCEWRRLRSACAFDTSLLHTATFL